MRFHKGLAQSDFPRQHNWVSVIYWAAKSEEGDICQTVDIREVLRRYPTPVLTPESGPFVCLFLSGCLSRPWYFGHLSVTRSPTFILLITNPY